jgi:hypothetical protein
VEPQVAQEVAVELQELLAAQVEQDFMLVAEAALEALVMRLLMARQEAAAEDLAVQVVMVAFLQAAQGQELLEQAAQLVAQVELVVVGGFQRLLRQLMVEQAE